MFSSATLPPQQQPPPQSLRHNFVVSAMTFEGPNLRFSNLTHALLIQISRTSSIIDIVVPSKMATGGHFVKKIQHQKKVPDRYEMARNAIKSDFWTSKNGRRRPFCQKLKKNKVLYRCEMARNAIKSEFLISKLADRSEMARNAIESDFRI